MLVLMLAGCGYDAPLDPDAEAVDNAIAGSVVVTGTNDMGPVMVLLFAAADPPPPSGTGSPVNFATIPVTSFTGGGAGVQSAPFSLTGVPDGDWIITAVMDVDGDFQPLLSSNAGITCGDWYGAHLADLSTGQVATVSVEGGELLEEVTVVIGSQMATERPAFTLTTSTVVQTEANQLLTLASTGVHSALVELADPGEECGTFFLFYAPDSNGDGAPDPHPEPALAQAGAYDIWPRLYLQYLGDDLEPGESYASEAVVYPAPLLQGQVAVGVPTPVTDLAAIFVPAARRTLPDGTEEVVQAPDLPTGAWSLTVVQMTGQTWTLPNETAAFPASDASWDPTAQGAYVIVQ